MAILATYRSGAIQFRVMIASIAYCLRVVCTKSYFQNVNVCRIRYGLPGSALSSLRAKRKEALIWS